MKSCFLYWIKLPSHTDITSEGYVGISANPSSRFKQHMAWARKLKRQGKNHKLANALLKHPEILFTVVLEGSRDYCLEMENKLRPSQDIGYNHAAGGVNDQPALSRLSVATAESVREKLRLSAIEAYRRDPSLIDKCGKRNTGRTLSDSHKQGIGAAMKGRGDKWRNPKADPKTWGMAKVCFQLYLQGAQQTQMSQETNLPVGFCQTIIRHFRKGWNPSQDPDWLLKFN